MSNFKLVAGVAAGFVAGCAVAAIAHDAVQGLPDRDPGSNQVLNADLETASGLEVIISDVVLPPNSALPKHYHPGEEFAYMIDGSLIFSQEDEPDLEIKAGEAASIRKERVHAVRTGDAPTRIIVFRVHPKGEPERVLVDE